MQYNIKAMTQMQISFIDDHDWVKEAYLNCNMLSNTHKIKMDMI